MQVITQSGDLRNYPAGALIVTAFDGDASPGGAAADIDAALEGAVSRLVQEGDVRGKKNEATLIHTLGRIPSPRVLVVGVGKREAFDGQVLRNALAVGARYLRRVGAESVAASADASLGLAPDVCAQAIVEGVMLGLYRFLVHKKEPEDNREVREFTLVEGNASRVDAVRQGAERGAIIAEAVNFARDLGNEPGNVLTPTEFAARAEAMAQETGLELQDPRPREGGGDGHGLVPRRGAAAASSRRSSSSSRTRAPAMRSRWGSSARASRSIRAASRSSRRRACRR